MAKGVKIRAVGRVGGKIAPRDIEVAERCLTRAYSINERLFPGVKPEFTMILCYSRKSYDKLLVMM